MIEFAKSFYESIGKFPQKKEPLKLLYSQLRLFKLRSKA